MGNQHPPLHSTSPRGCQTREAKPNQNGKLDPLPWTTSNQSQVCKPTWTFLANKNDDMV